MSRRSLSHRLSSSLLGAWFALFSVAPQSWRPCPMHGPGEDAGHGAAHAVAPIPANADSMAGMPCEHAQAAPLSTPAPHHEPMAPHPCDCPPSCCFVPAVALLHRPLQLDLAPLRVVERATLPPVTRRISSSARLLPFANGPPAVTAG